MYLTSLSLVNFRNYVRLELELEPHITVLKGDNAQGKTNFLEAIYYLSTASSPRADADRQLINWLAEEDTFSFARLVGRIAKGEGSSLIEIALVRNDGNGEAIRKAIRINGADRRVADLIGQVNVVLFLPQDIQLVDRSPGLRRRYLNALNCQIDPRYYLALQKYGQVVYQRNHLLRRLRGWRGDADQLAFWDNQMVELGAYLVARRRWLIRRLNAILAEIHPRLTGGREQMRLCYQPSVCLDEAEGEGYQLAMPLAGASDIQADVQRIAQAFGGQLAALRQAEMERGASLLGPHRDDMRFLANGVDMTIYGSRGQQRTAALSTKLAEVEWLRQETGEMPILLLDDMASELDPARRGYLIDTLDRAQQVIITATDVTGYPAGFLARARLLEVREGRIAALELPALPR